MGLDQRSLVRDATAGALLERITAAEQSHRVQFFAEEFLPGLELKVAILADGSGGADVIGVRAINLEGLATPLLTYELQWSDLWYGADEWWRCSHLPAGHPLHPEALSLASACWRSFGLKGWARVDMREDGQGRLRVLEVNCNPGIAPDSGFVESAEHAGLSPADVIRRILSDLSRPRRRGLA
jgi:D-alanine-D-alanine ligase